MHNTELSLPTAVFECTRRRASSMMHVLRRHCGVHTIILIVSFTRLVQPSRALFPIPYSSLLLRAESVDGDGDDDEEGGDGESHYSAHSGGEDEEQEWE